MAAGSLSAADLQPGMAAGRIKGINMVQELLPRGLPQPSAGQGEASRSPCLHLGSWQGKRGPEHVLAFTGPPSGPSPALQTHPCPPRMQRAASMERKSHFGPIHIPKFPQNSHRETRTTETYVLLHHACAPSTTYMLYSPHAPSITTTLQPSCACSSLLWEDRDQPNTLQRGWRCPRDAKGGIPSVSSLFQPPGTLAMLPLYS